MTRSIVHGPSMTLDAGGNKWVNLADGVASSDAATVGQIAGAAVTFATPAIVLGTAAAAGATDQVIRKDATIVAFDATAPTTQAFGDAAAVGTAAVAARRDHKHAMPAVDNSTVEINAATLRVKADGITANEIAAGAVGASELASTAVAAGTYGDATHSSQVTIDADGRVTSASSVVITGAGGGTGYLGYILLQDQKAVNSGGGGLTAGSYQTRTLNTEVTDTNSDCSLSSNQFTLTAGDYEIFAMVPAYAVTRFKARLRNVTDSATVVVGTSGYSNPTADTAQSYSIICGRFTIAASKALEIQMNCSATNAGNGAGVADNLTEVEIYTFVELRRVS